MQHKILETVIYSDDLDAVRKFYEDLLELPLLSAEPGRHLFFRLGNSMLLVFDPKNTRNATVKVGDQTIPRHGADGACHLALEVAQNQIQTLKSRLIANGVEIESEIDWPGGGHSVSFRDPAGNSIEFATRELWFKDSP